MPIHIERAVRWLAEPSWSGPWPEGAPERDFRRSAAAAAVGRLAHEAGLFLFHFEHRVPLELPAHWVAPGREDDALPPTWDRGLLPESKYQSFRHDLHLGSFHPGHRGKWTTHELCHGLVGTAWRPDASPLFHATAARLAELLPVVLWYFLDEVGLRRCPDHAGGGALYQVYCPECERVVEEGPVHDPAAAEKLEGARRFLEGELAAIQRTVRLGRPLSHRFGPLDLATDGVAYAAAHGRRLGSEAMHRLAERFDVGFRSLEDLEQRVLEVTRAICEGAPLSPLPGPSEGPQGRERWVAQDLAWRLLQVAEETDGEARTALLELVDGLAEGSPAAEVVARYEGLFVEHVLPEPELLFAVGYDLEDPAGFGRSAAQIRDGLQTVCPLVLELGDEADLDLPAAFVRADAPERTPLGDRFAAWLAREQPGPVVELATYEAALRLAGGDPLAGSLGQEGAVGPWRCARGARAMVFERDPTVLAERVDAGEVRGLTREGRLVLDGPVPEPDPTGLVVSRDGAGEVVVVEVPAEAAAALASGGEPALEPEERALLVELGLLVPTAWSFALPGDARG